LAASFSGSSQAPGFGSGRRSRCAGSTSTSRPTGTLHVVSSKTDAGVRTVDLTEALREELVLWRAESRFTEPDDFVLPTSTGRRHSPSNLRRDVLRPAVGSANAKLEKDGIAPIAESLGFHGLRRTYASLRCACGDDVAYASSQLGHEDPRFTLRVYAQATKRRDRLSGPTARPTIGRLNGHEWAQSRQTSRWLFLRRQQKTPPERGFLRSG
jgi:integrase